MPHGARWLKFKANKVNCTYYHKELYDLWISWAKTVTVEQLKSRQQIQGYNKVVPQNDLDRLSF